VILDLKPTTRESRCKGLQ